MPQQLQPRLSHQFAGVIWRMEIDAKGETLALEIRHEADKQVSFAAVNLNTAQVLLENYTAEERWMAGLEGVFDGVVLLHYYQSAGSPSHRAIIAIDAATGQPLWSNYNLAFHHFSINGPVVYDTRLQPRTLQLADIKSGQVLRPYQQVVDNEVESDLLMPEVIFGDSQLPEPAYGNMAHRLLYKQYIIVSLHAQAIDGSLVQKLFIISNGKTVFTDLLNTGIQKLQPEAFVLKHNCLIYLKERSQLKIINL